MHHFVTSISLISQFYLLLSLFAFNAFAQTEQSDSLQITELEDSTLIEQAPIFGDTTIVVEADSLETEDSLQYNANKALMWSAIIPGGGQVYNKQYWKAPIFAALFGTGLTLTIDNQKKYKSYDNELSIRQMIPADTVNFLTSSNAQLLNQKLKYKRQRSLSVALTLVSYSFNLMDAFATANLLNSDLDHSPARAAYYSAVLPGLGQYYNKKLWKIPVIYAGFGVGGYAIYYNFDLMKRYTDAYIFYDENNYQRSQQEFLLLRERTLKRLELSIILTSLWYVVNILDATVDGHLHDFDKELEGFSSRWSISPQMTALHDGGMAWGYGFQWRF